MFTNYTTYGRNDGFANSVKAVLVLAFLFCSTWIFGQNPVWHLADQKTNLDEENTTVSVAAPDNISSGDLIVIIVTTQRSGDDNGDPALGFYNLPTGFNLIATSSDLTNHNRPEIAAFYKIATGSEPATYSFNVYDYGDDPDWQIIAGRVTGHDATTPIGNTSTVHSSNSQVSDITVPAMNTTETESLVIGGRAVRTNEDNISTDPASWSLIFANDGLVDGDQDDEYPGFHVVERDFTPVGTTGALEFDWTNETARATALMFEIRREACSPNIGNPTFTLGSTSSRCAGAGSVTYTATEPNATSIDYALDAASLTAGNSINSTTGEVTFIAGWTGESAITATASGCGGPTTATHVVTTQEAFSDLAFDLGSESGVCPGGSVNTYSARATGDTSIVYSIDAVSSSAGVTIYPDFGAVTFPSTYSGTVEITATAEGCGGSGSVTHTVTVTELGALDDSTSLQENDSATVFVIANDICDIDTSSVIITVGPANGTATAQGDGNILYVPTTNFFGTDSLTYRICGLDNPVNCADAKVYFTVTEKLTDTYFNQPASNCQSLPNVESGFGMVQQYETADSVALYSNPQVADLDGDGTTEILALGVVDLTTSSPRNARNLKVFNGQDGTTIRDIVTPYISYDGPTPMAMGDLDNDGDVEIIIASLYTRNIVGERNRLFCYDHLGNLLWKSDTIFGENVGGNAGAANVGLADFNNDGAPEVYIYNEIFNALTGAKLADGGSHGIGQQETYNSIDQATTVAANVNATSNLELIAGRTVYEVVLADTSTWAVGNTMTAGSYSTTGTNDGYSAVADMDLDGDLDVITLTQDGDLTVWNPRTLTVMDTYVTGEGNDAMGSIFIGDVDNTGVPNIGYCRDNEVDMLEFDTLTSTLSEKWQLSTSDGSGRTGLTMFDFDQNGSQEIVYRDEDSLRILDGSGTSAVTLFAVVATSSTGMEGPIVADVDDDGSAEILVTSEGPSSNDDRVSRVTVWRSNTFRWAPARKVWNQYVYFNTHVNDDFTITTNQSNHGQEYFTNSDAECPESFTSRPLNAFMVQATYFSNNGCPDYSVPDAEMRINSVSLDTVTDIATVNYTARNRATGVVLPSDVIVSFYTEDPIRNANAVLLTTDTITTAIETAGKTGELTKEVPGVEDEDTVYAVINDDGGDAVPFTLPTTEITECNYANNQSAFQAFAPTSLGVELIRFTAHKYQDEVAIHWETISEINNDFFVVEKSLDGIHFRSLDTLIGAGTYVGSTLYDSKDSKPADGINYYRLYQMDFDGSYSYSQIVAVDFTREEFVLFPNPSSDKVHILNPFEGAIYHMFDPMGKRISTGSFYNAKHTIDVSNLSSGIYLISIRSTTGQEQQLFRLKVL